MDTWEVLREVSAMIVQCRVDDLLQLIGKPLTLEEVEETLFLLKAEIESVQGNRIEIEVNPDRQDMLSSEGIARAIRAFLGIEPGLRRYYVKKSPYQVIVKPGLEKIRPFISCGIVKGVETSDELIKDYMHLQELLTTTHGRNRKKASIGLYVFDDIDFPVTYQVEKPDSIKFVPLGSETPMDGWSIVRTHDKGIAFGPIISGFKKWPLLVDSVGKVLSLPPVINSNDLGRLTTSTRNMFVEVTGTQRSCVDQALNIMIASLADRGGKIESVTVLYPDGTEVDTPDLSPGKMPVATEDVIKLTGLALGDQQVVDCLRKTGYGARIASRGRVAVEVPAYRIDILHTVDLIEDVAIGYGFDKIEPTMPVTTTVGRLLPTTRLKNKVRDLMVGAGYQEIMTYVMSSPDVMSARMMRDLPLVTTGNPRSLDFSVLRNSLLPALMDFISRNQHADYPQRVFEVGDVVISDENAETRTLQRASVCGLIADARVNLTEIMTQLGFVLRNLGFDNRFRYAPLTDQTYIEGRAARILIDDKTVGALGEISPEVITRFGMAIPVVAFEFFLVT